jgi:hypothetical protein
MSLSTHTASIVVQSVSRSTQTRQILKTSVPEFLQKLGIAGDLRNWLLVAMGNDGSEPESAAIVCVGIASATASDIQSYIQAGKLPDVEAVSTCDRSPPTVEAYHTATLVTMMDKTQYVFDWHATLNPNDPWISRLAEWLVAKGGQRFALFKGFS